MWSPFFTPTPPSSRERELSVSPDHERVIRVVYIFPDYDQVSP